MDSLVWIHPTHFPFPTLFWSKHPICTFHSYTGDTFITSPLVIDVVGGLAFIHSSVNPPSSAHTHSSPSSQTGHCCSLVVNLFHGGVIPFSSGTGSEMQLSLAIETWRVLLGEQNTFGKCSAFLRGSHRIWSPFFLWMLSYPEVMLRTGLTMNTKWRGRGRKPCP